MLKYPLYTDYRNKLKEDYNELLKHKIQLIDIKKAKKITSNYKFEKCDGKYAIVIEKYSHDLIRITDYFSDKCRIHCKKYNKKKTPYEIFSDIGKKFYDESRKYINKYPDYFWWSFNKYLTNNHIKCELFGIPVVRDIYTYFNATDVLDFSAGWGDRLIAAISLNIKYTGVDPSVCMKPIYKQIIKKLSQNKKNYKIINMPFEKVKLKHKYDFIFSSPPFFKLETYENNQIMQSIKQYDTIDKWKTKFLYVVIDKCNKYLKKNKYFCIHIQDYLRYKYVEDMIRYIKDNTNMKYVGKFYYIYTFNFQNNDDDKRPAFIYVFKKVN